VIDGAPQVHPLPGDPDDHLVEVPSLARARAALPQVARDQWAELQHPAPHSLIGDLQAALGQKILDVAVAQSEAQIQPDRMLDDRRRKPMPMVREWSHDRILSHSVIRSNRARAGYLHQSRRH
jgi:hypothetical protein